MSVRSAWRATRERRIGLRSDAGVTLIELVITVAIMGIAFTAILGGVMTAVIGSDIHRKQANAETILRSYAEAVKSAGGWEGCSATTATYSPASVGYTLPSDFSAYNAHVVANGVEYWDPSSPTGWSTMPCSTDPGLQRITLEVASPDLKAVETVQVVRRMP